MKTKFKFASFFALLLTLLSFAPKNLSAQCAQIHNSLPCPVSVQVDFLDIAPDGSCTQLCASYVIPNINPNQIMPINCGLCPQFCDIQVTVLTIGGVPAAGTAGTGNLPPGNPVTGGRPGCITTTSAIYYLPGAPGTFRIVP